MPIRDIFDTFLTHSTSVVCRILHGAEFKDWTMVPPS